ncbi:MAG: glycosyltransferase [Chitinophagales bacterium]
MVDLIIPFYNEEQRIPFFKDTLQGYLLKNQYVDAVTMVNDGSKDQTQTMLEGVERELQLQFPQVDFKVINVVQNAGKGNAIRAGVLASKSKWVLSSDADFATLPEQLDQWVEQGIVDLKEQEITYIGSRELGMEQKLVKALWHRRVIGRVFSTIVYWCTGIAERDTQCGFKLYPTHIAITVFKPLVELGYAHDVEILFRLIKAGKPIKSLPLKWEERGLSKVNLVRDSFKMFMAIIKMRSYI